MRASRVTVLRVAELMRDDAQSVRAQLGLVLVDDVRARVATTGAGTLLTLERTVARPTWLRRRTDAASAEERHGTGTTAVRNESGTL